MLSKPAGSHGETNKWFGGRKSTNACQHCAEGVSCDYFWHWAGLYSFTAALVSSLLNPPGDVGETAGESANIWKQRANFSGTCGVYNVSVGLRATAGLHTDAHVLPLGQSPLGGEVAGYIWVNDRLIWEREKRQTSEQELWAAWSFNGFFIFRLNVFLTYKLKKQKEVLLSSPVLVTLHSSLFFLVW